MKLINPKPRKVFINARQNDEKDQIRVEVRQKYPIPEKGRRVWSFTLYDTDLNEVKNVLIRIFEDITEESFSKSHKKKLK